MSVHAFRMQLKPGALAEYRRRHDEIWPDLSQLLKESGIGDYRIFVDAQSGALFAVLTLSETNSRDSLPFHPVMRRWWDYMAELMVVDETNRPTEWPLEEVFHLP
ncbi:MAG: L-rhamnose mutarotase [Novosphingobium sp.]